MSFLNPITASLLEAHRFSTSWLLPTPVLGGLRLLIALYIFTTISTVLGIVSIQWHDKADAGSQFTYFTVLTYWGLGFYFLVSGVHSLMTASRGKSLLQNTGRVYDIARWLHAAFYASVTVFPFIVTGKS